MMMSTCKSVLRLDKIAFAAITQADAFYRRSFKKKQLQPKQEYVRFPLEDWIHLSELKQQTWSNVFAVKKETKKPLLLMCACCNNCWRPTNNCAALQCLSFWHLNFAYCLHMVKIWTVGKKIQSVMNCLNYLCRFYNARFQEQLDKKLV